MLPILEKVLWSLTGLFVVVLAAGLAFFGLPSTTPSIAMSSKEITQAELDKRLSAEQRQRLLAEQRGIDLGEDGQPVPRADGKRPAKQIIYDVNDELLDRLGNLNDCMNELKLASSEVQEDGSLKVFDIVQGSLLEKVGLEDNDIIDRVGGLKVDFGNVSQCHDTWEQCLEKLEGGSPFVVELRRKGAVHQLTVSRGQ